MKPRSPQTLQTWVEIIPFGAPVPVSTLTTLLAFTDLGSDWERVAIMLSNEDATNEVTLIVEVSHGGAHANDERTQMKSCPALAERSVLIDAPNEFTYVGIAAQTDSPSYPTVNVKFAVLGIHRR